MKKITYSLFVFAALFAAGCANKILKEAEKAYHNEQFSAAARMYENVLKENPDQGAMLHLADCYRRMNRHEEAEKWYSKSISSASVTAEDKLHYAEVLKEEGKYNEAALLLEAYLQTAPEDVKAKNMLTSCRSSETYNKVNPFYTVEKVDFGFAGSCFSPSAIGNDLLVSAASTPKPGAPVDFTSGNSFLDLYVISPAKKEAIASSNGTNGSVLPVGISPVGGMINSPLHEGPAVISPSGGQLFFTRSLMMENKPGEAKDHDNHLELCSADKVNGNWENIRSLPFNSAEYSVGHPALASNGTRLFFVSDMPGGFGGTDIYYSDFTNGNWSAPVNAGSAVNTNGNEMFPSIHMLYAGNDEFYFSSDGLAGAGGLDLFKCKMENGLPADPERLPAPFNSSYDDFGIMFNAGGISGYFSSNRGSAEGKDDIYSFKRRTPKFFVKAELRDKTTNQPITGIQLETKINATGDTFNLPIDKNGTVIFPADSLTYYSFCVRDIKYFACFGGVSTGGFKGSFSDTTYVLMNVEPIVINKPIRLENIYYDYNKWNIRPDAAIELDKLVKILVDNPKINIELSSHTDSRGSDKYNMSLSQKRAQSAVDYIISKGISKDRITAKGYGESMPLNKCVNGVKCTEEEYQWNRRTEFKVTKIVTQ